MTQSTQVLILGAAAVAATGWGIARVVLAVTQWERRRLQRRLGEQGWEAAVRMADQASSIRKHETRAGFAAMLPERWRKALQQASPDLNPARFALLVIGLGLVSYMALYMVTGAPLPAFVGALVGGTIPLLRVSAQRARRQRLMTDQLVEGLEFLARVLRAGHSLATGIQMMGNELPEPLAGEFRQCYDEHALGQPMEDALVAMAHRVDSVHFSFFVTSVVIQRQTGGDLAEILDNICTIVRSRIRLQQHVKAITAEGRLTGYILSVFPVVILIATSMLNPEYAGTLLRTQAGQFALALGLIMQVMALLIIRRIVTVTV